MKHYRLLQLHLPRSKNRNASRREHTALTTKNIFAFLFSLCVTRTNRVFVCVKRTTRVDVCVTCTKSLSRNLDNAMRFPHEICTTRLKTDKRTQIYLSNTESRGFFGTIFSSLLLSVDFAFSSIESAFRNWAIFLCCALTKFGEMYLGF